MPRLDQDGEPFKTIEIYDYLQWIELKKDDPLYVILMEYYRKEYND